MYRRTPARQYRTVPLKLMPALACSKIIRSNGTLSLGEREMEAREDWARITRGIQEAFSGLIGAVGAVRVARKDRRTKPRSIRLISWAGRANTDAWFLMQLEQSKDRALLYYTKNQIR